MSYTPEQVDALSDKICSAPANSMIGTHVTVRVADAAEVVSALRAYAATLRQPSADSGRVGDESCADLLQRMGDDAAKWAAEFRATAVRLGYSDMDEGWLIGWFANAIEHSGDVRRWRKEAALAAQGQITHDSAPVACESRGEFDARKYINHLADLLELGASSGVWKVDADLQRLAAAVNANLPAPAPAPAPSPPVAHGAYREALQRIVKLPARPFPDPYAHSWEAFGRAVMGAFTDARMAAIRAIQDTPAPAASPAGVPDGYVLVPTEAGDTDAFMVLHEYQQPGRTRKDAYRIAIRKLGERANEALAAAPSAKPEGDGGAA